MGIAKTSPGPTTAADSRWTIVGRKNGLWELVCQCGTRKAVKSVQHVKSGRSLSCGCVRSERLSAKNKTHGMSGHPIHVLWKGMHARCRDKNHVQYPDYGGRGIKVCKRWSGKTGFAFFMEDMGPRPEGFTIERKNNNGGYSPGNCCWAPAAAQGRNKRNNLMLTAFGRTQCLAAWSEEYGMGRGKLYHRIVAMKLDPETALTLPSRYKTR